MNELLERIGTVENQDRRCPVSQDACGSSDCKSGCQWLETETETTDDKLDSDNGYVGQLGNAEQVNMPITGEVACALGSLCLPEVFTEGEVDLVKG